jgi:hypothetical protein
MIENESQMPADQESGAIQPSPERSRAEIVESLNALEVTDSEKITFLLIYLGEKPATHLHRRAARRVPGEPERISDHTYFDQAVAWAEQSGLAYEVETEVVNPAALPFKGTEGQWLRKKLDQAGQLEQAEAEIARGVEEDRLNLYLARDEIWLEKMKAAVKDNDPRLYGESVGFPDTAIDAYINQEAVGPGTLADQYPADVIAFAKYGISLENADAELTTAQRWADAVRQADPPLYERVLEHSRQQDRP